MGGKSEPVSSKRIIAASLLLVISSPLLCLGAAKRKKQVATVPETPAGRQLAGFLRAYNTGEPDTLRKFIAEHFDKTVLEKRSADERASTGIATFKITRQLNLHSIGRSTDYEVEVLCQSEITEAWFSVTLQVTPQSPYKIVKQAFGFAARPADAVSHRRLHQKQIVKELKTYLAKLIAADMLSGAVLVARNGRPIFEGAYGFNASKIPNRIDTKFDLASMSKMFTSVAVAQLAERGKLSYSEPVGKFLPDYPNKKAAEKVTLHHLLTHTSGVVDFLDKKEYQSARHGGGGRFQTMQDWFSFFASDPLSFEPGEKNDYSNSNFIILGALIERVTGQSYFDYVGEHIFRPAGMSHTAFAAATGNSAGGGLSTVRDLLKFDVALRRHKLLGANYTNLILAPKVDTGEGEAYGYGFEINQVKGSRIVGHSGGTADVDNKFEMYLDDGYTVIALTKPHAAKNITRKLKELITQGDCCN